MQRGVEFKSSEGGRISDFPGDLGEELERFLNQISKLPGEHKQITSLRGAHPVDRPRRTVARIARIRRDHGITTVERYTVWTPPYVHTLDFAEKQGGRRGKGPYWAYIMWVRRINHGLLPMYGFARHSCDANLKWPTELVPGFEPYGPNSHHNGHSHNPLAPLLRLQPRSLKNQPV